MEREAYNKFHVFDIQLIQNSAHWETIVHRKPLASDNYLHFTSVQAWQEKAGAIHTGDQSSPLLQHKVTLRRRIVPHHKCFHCKRLSSEGYYEYNCNEVPQT